jgi:hypothetical protein
MGGNVKIMHRLAAAALVILAALALAPGARADKQFPADGGPGEGYHRMPCDPGTYLVGFRGRTGAWIDRIGVGCAPIRPELEWRVSDRFEPYTFGGFGGGFDDEFCNADEVVTGIRPTLTPGNQVLKIQFYCSSMKTWERRRTTFGGVGQFGADARRLPWQVCPYGTVGDGLLITSGKHVNAVGLHCGTYAPQVAAKPAPAGPPPALEPSVGFSGLWETTTSLGGKFKMALTVSSNGTGVTGMYVHDNKKYNGTLAGGLDPSGQVLTYAWTSPGVSASGSGTFALMPSGTIAGSFISHNDPDPRPTYQWVGKRIHGCIMTHCY